MLSSLKFRINQTFKNYQKCNKQSGFSLIELLVVVSIIAILSVIAVNIYSGVQRDVRDARRRADVIAIANALEIARGTSATYPALRADMFAAGNIPQLDPQGLVYCGNTDLDATPSGGLTQKSTATACTPSGAGNYNPISTTIPQANTSVFKICTYLENGTSFCRPSAQ